MNTAAINQKWQRRSQARPGEILEAALSLFVARGFAATKIEDIAEGAGVSKGTVYLYFKSKEDIFRSLVHELVLPEIERVQELVSEYQGTRKELLIMILQNMWNTFNEKKLSGMPKLMVAEAANFPELAKFYVNNVIHRGLEVIAGIIQQGIVNGEFKNCDPVITARLITSPLVYLAIWDHSLRPYDEKHLDSETFVKCQLEIALNGILNENTG